MSLAELENFLIARFDAQMAAGFDGVIRLSVDAQSLTCTIRDGQLTCNTEAAPDVTFMFSDFDTAMAILSGQTDPIDAFMQGRFKADGYLMWAFAMMAFFRSESLPVHPIE